ncbi:MAG: hypothetical protein WC610_00075 [Patescibacteria group bacterium]
MFWCINKKIPRKVFSELYGVFIGVVLICLLYSLGVSITSSSTAGGAGAGIIRRVQVFRRFLGASKAADGFKTIDRSVVILLFGVFFIAHLA